MSERRHASKTVAKVPLVLVVDDSADTRQLYVAFLELSGFRADEAGDGQAALDRVAANRPDVILLDLSLPVLNGREVARRLKADPATKGIIVVLLTGQVMVDPKELGCDALLTKPCLPEVLVQTITELTGLRHSAAAQARNR